MSPNTVIKCVDIGKKYSSGTNIQGLRSLFSTKFLKRDKLPSNNEFWALKAINFEVDKGDVLGFIGHNGAGKSTLLRILSRITKPTTGYADIHGKVASLLEVGAGFHPELNAIENIKFNGAILGIRSREVKNRIDEILDFSGLSAFKDKPVKYYSTGMYIRLGFSVASILRPEVLLIDEILSVGDLAFQKKSLTKIQAVIQDGATVIVCSHDLGTIKSICNKGLLLENGFVKSSGLIDSVLSAYMDTQLQEVASNFTALQNDYLQFQKIICSTENNSIPWSQPITFSFELIKKQKIQGSRLLFRVQNQMGHNLLNFFTEQLEHEMLVDEVMTLQIQLPGKILPPGVYTISVQLLLSGFGQIIRQTTIGRFIVYSESEYPEILMSDTMIAPAIKINWQA